MTWASLFYNTNLNVNHVGCDNGSYGCNAYSGDTNCSTLKVNLPRPDYPPFPTAAHAPYDQWSGGYINISKPYLLLQNRYDKLNCLLNNLR